MARDTTKYNFNNKKNLNKRELAKDIIEKYLYANRNKNYEELQDIFNIKEFGYKKTILNEKDYLSWKEGKKDSQDRYFPSIAFGNEKIYIKNQWGIDNISNFIEMVKKEFNYEIETSDNIENTDNSSQDDINQSKEKKGNLENFQIKNLLLKGVPGTGKSRAIENIINNKLELKDHKENILRINIHSASSNADLMQGIGISSKDGKIEYKEKQGLILNLIQRATFNPNQPFVLILEEIQENSLNELIGDLIYLIEEDKRAKTIVADDEEYGYQELVEKIVADNPETAYVEIPYLVNDSTEYRKMIMPNNLYIFCTSNYRDDKKVIEDNLLRRFEVLEIYPKVDVVHEYCKEFFSQLNENILKVMNDEIHPDRFLIGHSNWLKVATQKDFYRVFLKVVVEFKDIKEVEFSEFKEIVEKLPLVDELDFSSYKELIEDLQTKAGYDFLD
jgi:hypothetical protein